MNNPILKAWITGCTEVRLIATGEDHGMPESAGVAFIWHRADGSHFHKIVWSNGYTCNRLYPDGKTITNETYFKIDIAYAEAVEVATQSDKVIK